MAAPRLPLDAWLAGAHDDGVEGTVFSHLLRMAGRATPLGLSATVTAGSIGEVTAFELTGDLHAVERRPGSTPDGLRGARACSLSAADAAAIADGAALLASLTAPAPPAALALFCERMTARWGEEAVPLARALEMGVPEPAPQPPRAGRADAVRMRLIERALREGGDEVELRDEDVERLRPRVARALPGAFSAVVTLATDGDLRLHGLTGPSGIRSLRRFDHLSADIRELCDRHRALEREQSPGASFVAIEEIDAASTLVRVRDGVAELWADGRRVYPRIESATDYAQSPTALVRLLGMMQDPQGPGWIGWSWGAAGLAPFLPRVRFGRLVLSLASWRGLDAPGLPRHVAVGDGDRLLAGDREHPAARAALERAYAKARSRRVVEVWPGTDRLAVRGRGRGHAHELIVPFTAPVPAPPSPPPSVVTVARRFAPGSEWSYAKLYADAPALERLLLGEVSAAVSGRWHFLRYADPEEHLRVRVHDGDLTGLVRRLVDAGLVWRGELSTYEREVDRYGGPEAIEPAEEAFRADSEAVLVALRTVHPDDSAARLALATLSVDALLEDFLDPADALELLADLRERLPARPEERRRRAAAFRELRATYEAPVPAPFAVRSGQLEPVAAAMRAVALSRPLPEVVAALAHMSCNRILRADQRTLEPVALDHVGRLRLARIARGQPAASNAASRSAASSTS